MRGQATPKTEGFDDDPVETAAERKPLAVINDAEAAGMGMESVGAEDVLTPFIGIVQPTSKVLAPQSGRYLPDAKQGDLLNTATGQLYKELEFVPCFHEHIYGAWVPIRDGGGFRGKYDPTDPIVVRLVAEAQRERRSFKPLPWRTEDEEDVELIDEHDVWGIFGPPPLSIETMFAGILPFTSTKIPVYRTMMTKHSSVLVQATDGTLRKAALFRHRWRLTTDPRSNDQGNWFVYKIDFVGGTPTTARIAEHDQTIYRMAYEMCQTLTRDRTARDRANRAAYSATVAGEDADTDAPF